MVGGGGGGGGGGGASDELLREKASKIVNNPKLNRYQRGYNG